MKTTLYHLGLIDYQAALHIQIKLAEEIAAGQHPPALLLLEHPHVYTFGRQGKLDNLLWDENQLADKGISVEWTDRGGDVTYHGPGQLVGYPLLPLKRGVQPTPQTQDYPFGWDIIGYLRKLEQVLIHTLAEFNISAIRVPDQTGVWVAQDPKGPPAKIASIGVRVDANGITRHGFALNVAPDMAYWKGILACGLENQNKTSMHLLLAQAPVLKTVRNAAAGYFAQVFGVEIQPGDQTKIQHLIEQSV